MAIFSFFLIIQTSPVIAENNWVIYKIKNGTQTFKIPYEITNGTITKIESDINSSTVLIHLQRINADQETSLKITIPRELTNGLPLSKPLILLLDNNQISFEEINTSSCFRTLSIQLPPVNSVGKSELLEIVTSNVGQMPMTEDVPSIHIATDKTNYQSSDHMVISGCTSLGLEGNQVTINFFSSDGQLDKTITAIPSIDGSFSSSITLDEKNNGTYSVNAIYAGQNTTSYFTVPEFPQALIALVIAVSLGITMLMKNPIETNNLKK